MPSPIARIQFAWDFIGKSCRATALDMQDRVLARVIVELENDAVREIMAAGYIAKLRIEELAERQLRAVLALRY